MIRRTFLSLFLLPLLSVSPPQGAQPTYSLCVTNNGAIVVSETGMPMAPVENAGPPPRVWYTPSPGASCTYYIKPGDIVKITQTP